MGNHSGFLFALFFVAGMLGCVAAPSGARAEPADVSLNDVKLIAESGDVSIFRLEFSPKVGGYGVDAADPSHPILSLPHTIRAQSAVSPRNLRGLVRSMDFEQSGSTLTVKFGTNAPSKLATELGGDKGLLVTIRRLTGPDAAGAGKPASRSRESDAAVRTPVPHAIDPVPGEGFEMVMLKYADVSEVVGLLTDGVTIKSNNIFIRREPGFGLPGTTGSAYASAAAAEQDDKPLGQSVDSSLAVNRRLNSVWIKGTPQRIARIKEQIALIDVPVDSVILETQFVELTQTGARNLGIDFANANGQIAVGTVQAGQFIPFGFGTQRLDSAALQAALYAQVESGEGRIVSKPRIAAQSGSTAKIITGDALPILTAITLSGVNGRLTLESRLGVGTRVVVEVPFARP